jgi:hypothetical protein
MMIEKKRNKKAGGDNGMTRTMLRMRKLMIVAVLD